MPLAIRFADDTATFSEVKSINHLAGLCVICYNKTKLGMMYSHTNACTCLNLSNNFPIQFGLFFIRMHVYKLSRI